MAHGSHHQRHRTQRVGRLRAALRVTFWGALAMVLTGGLGSPVGAAL